MKTAGLALALLLFLPGTGLAEPLIFLWAEHGQVSLTSDQNVTAAGATSSFGVRAVTARNQDWQISVSMDVRGIDTSALGLSDLTGVTMFDFVNLGLHWFPRRPPLWLGPIAVRPELEGEGGLSFGSGGFDLPLQVAGGVALSGEQPVGVLLEGFWRITPERLTYQDANFNDHYVDVSPYFGWRAVVFF